MHVIETTEGKKKVRGKKVFEDIMVNMFPKLVKNINLKIQEE